VARLRSRRDDEDAPVMAAKNSFELDAHSASYVNLKEA
jgi:hypothetical protein